MSINGRTRVFMILGDPVAQVRAPEVFNPLFRQHGVNAVLVPAQVPPADFEGYVRHVLKAGNVDGFWVTIPHKTAMFRLMDRCDRLGRVAQSVNAVRRGEDGRLEGALFDGIGFTKALDDAGIPVAGRRVLLAGVGGAGVAIAASLGQREVGHLALFDPAPGRAADVAARLRAEFGVDAVAALSADPAGFHLAINATPLGLEPGDALPFDPARLDPGAAVFDILMKHATTPLVRACRARGIEAHAGFEMMVQQMPAYLAFFGYDELARTVQADPGPARALLAVH